MQEEEIKKLNQKDVDNQNLCDKKNEAIQVNIYLYILFIYSFEMKISFLKYYIKTNTIPIIMII